MLKIILCPYSTKFPWGGRLVTFLLVLLLCAGVPMFLRSSHDKEIPPPTIAVNPDIYYPLDEILYLEGRAQPNSTIQIQFQKQGAKSLRLVAKSDPNGEWVLSEKVPLEAGNWEVRARALETVKGEQHASEWSNPRVIKAIVTGVTLGGVTLKFSFIILLLGIAALVIIYLLWRIRQEVKEKQEALIADDFSELKRDITEELKHLEARRKLSKDEEEHRDKLLRDLEHVEREINKKLRGL